MAIIIVEGWVMRIFLNHNICFFYLTCNQTVTYIITMKDRQHTEQKIISAVEQIITEEGFQALGINKVAHQAGVSKVLIYRYFESFENLIQTAIIQNNYWIKTSAMLQKLTETPSEQLKAEEVIINVFREIRSNKFMREILRWQLISSDPLAKKFSAEIESAGIAINNHFKKKLNHPDLNAFSSIFIGGIYYLSLLQDKIEVFNEIQLSEGKEGWDRIEKALIQIVRNISDK